MDDKKINLIHCPFCGKPVEIHGGYYVNCTCGLHFSIGHCEIEEFAEVWNHRCELVSCNYCTHQGEDVNICLGCNNRSHFRGRVALKS